MLALQTGAIAGFLVFSLLADKWGRRTMFLLYLFIGAVAVGMYLATTQPLILMVAIFMAGFGVNGIFCRLRSFPRRDHWRHAVTRLFNGAGV